MCPPRERTTDDSRLDHCSIAPSISSWLIMSQQLFRTCFRWLMSSFLNLLTIYQLLQSLPNRVVHGIKIRWVARPIRQLNRVRNICLQERHRVLRSVRRRTSILLERETVYTQVTSLMTCCYMVSGHNPSPGQSPLDQTPLVKVGWNLQNITPRSEPPSVNACCNESDALRRHILYLLWNCTRSTNKINDTINVNKIRWETYWTISYKYQLQRDSRYSYYAWIQTTKKN